MAELPRFVLRDGINTPGGDGTTDANTGPNRAYASLVECEAAEQSDFVTAANNLVVYCSGDVAENNQVLIDGSTCSAAFDIKIIGNKASGTKWDNSAFRIVASINATDSALYINDTNVTCDALQCKSVVTAEDPGFPYYVVRVPAESYTLKNMSICAAVSGWSSGTSALYGIRSGTDMSQNSFVINTLIFDIVTDDASFACAFYEGNHAANKTYLYNNTIANVKIGINDGYSDVVCKNNILQAAAGGVCFDNAVDPSSNYNLSSDATAPGGNSVLNTVLTFADAASLDYHLAVTDTAAIGAATNLSGDAYYPFNNDADGDVRSSWDIGADEYAAAGGPTLILAAMSQAQQLGVAALTQHNTLAAAAMSQAQQLGVAALTQHNTLAAAAMSQAQQLDVAALTLNATLAAEAMSQAQTLSVTSLTVAGVLSVDELSQGQLIQNLALTQHGVLTIDTATQSQLVDVASITATAPILILATLSQAQLLNPATLAQHNILVVDDASQAQVVGQASFPNIVGWLKGTFVLVSALNGQITVTPALSGAFDIKPN